MACSTRTATSRRVNDLFLLRLGETLVGTTVCEDLWQPGRRRAVLALAGAELLVKPLRIAVPDRPGREREEMLVTRARDTRASSRSATRSAARTSSSSTATPASSMTRARPRAGARVRGDAARGRRRPVGAAIGSSCCRDVRRRALGASARRARGAGDRGRAKGSASADATVQLPARRAALSELESDAPRPRARPARLRRKNGFREVVLGVSGGIDSALTAALAVAGARRRPHPLRVDALALFVRGDAVRRATARGVAWDVVPGAADRPSLRR